MVSFHRREGIRRVLDHLGADKSMLTAYFEKNRTDETTRGILYRDFPEFYTWQAQGKFWQNRVRHDTLR
jgi:exonuclease I